MKTTSIACGLAILALGLGLSACGAGNGDSTAARSDGPGLPRLELAAKANAICATAKPKLRAIPEPATIDSDASAAAAYFDKVLPITDQETKQLEALTPAADVAADWRAFVTAQVAADRLLQTLKQKADAKDPRGLAYLKRVQPAGQVVANAASRLGAAICASG